MDCPVCKNEPMIVLELNDVEIDYCLSCKGIWLDTGELELLLESSAKTLFSAFQIFGYHLFTFFFINPS